MKNRYKKRSHISELKFKKLLKSFCLDLNASQISELLNINRNTVNKYLTEIRIRIAEICEQQFSFKGVIEVDESYFGARRQKGKRGRGSFGKTIVFGIYKRNGFVYTEIIPDVSRRTIQAIIRGKVQQKSVIHSDKWKAYNGLVDLGYKKHYRLDHSRNEFVKGKSHINGIEGFWGFAKSRLAKFKGMNRKTFYLHLKECEFRFNFRNENIYKMLLKNIVIEPLN
jgi:transposase